MSNGEWIHPITASLRDLGAHRDRRWIGPFFQPLLITQLEHRHGGDVAPGPPPRPLRSRLNSRLLVVAQRLGGLGGFQPQGFDTLGPGGAALALLHRLWILGFRRCAVGRARHLLRSLRNLHTANSNQLPFHRPKTSSLSASIQQRPAWPRLDPILGGVDRRRWARSSRISSVQPPEAKTTTHRWADRAPRGGGSD